MNTYVISDTHLNLGKIKTYRYRPADFTEQLIRNWQRTIQPDDLVIHCGDVFIGNPSGWKVIWPSLPGRKILVRGNHDRNHSNSWWMSNGFDFACDGFRYRDIWFSHEPAKAIQTPISPVDDRPQVFTYGTMICPNDCSINIHGHLHNIWHGFHKNSKPGDPEYDSFREQKLDNPWQRLFAVEYTNYTPISLDKFLTNPDKYQARGPRYEFSDRGDMMYKIIRNSAHCLRCDDRVESKSVHDWVQCKCGAIFTDGGKEYVRQGGNRENLEDTSIVEEIPNV